MHKTLLSLLAVLPCVAQSVELPTLTVETDAPLETNPQRATLQQARPAADGGDYLRSLTGVSGVRMGGHGIDPIVRGQSQTRLNVLLDGAYVHGGCPNRMDPPTAYVPVNTYDEVEVIKGGRSVMYGGGGSGGTVLFRRSPPSFAENQSVKGRLDSSYDANADTAQVSADLAAGSEQGYVRGLAHYADAGNYQDGAGNEVRSAYQSHGGALILGYTPAPHTRLEVSGELNRDADTLYAGAGMDAPVSDHDLYRAKFKRSAPLGVFDSLDAEVSYSSVAHVMDNYSLRALGGPMKMRVPSDSDTLSGRVSAGLRANAELSWRFGLNHQNNQREAVRYAGMASLPGDPVMAQALMWPDAQLTQSGLFAEADWQLNSEARWLAGLRYDRVSASAARADHAVQGNRPNDLYRQYYGVSADDAGENNWGGFLTYERGLNASTLLSVSLSRAVRTADASERYMASSNSVAAQRWVGNPGLQPEHHHQMELGLNYEQAAWQSAVSVFYNAVSDYILLDRAHAQAGVLQNDNATIYRNVDARLYGLEWESRWRGPAGLSAGLQLAYVHATNTRDDRPIAQTPPLQSTFSLRYDAPRWWLDGSARLSAKQKRVDADTRTGSGVDAGTSPGFGVLDLSAGYHLRPGTELTLGLNNVFDKTYAYHVNRANADPFSPGAARVNEPGRSLWLGLSAAF